MLVKVLLLALGCLWVSDATGLSFWTTAILGVIGWTLWQLAQHKGWLGLSKPATTSGGGIDLVGTMTKGVVWYTTFTLVMMVGTKLVGVSNNFALSYFLTIGGRVWFHPGGHSTDILIWIAVAFFAAIVASCTMVGRYKPAAVIFGLTLAILGIYREMPRLFEASRPKPTSPVTPRPAVVDKATGKILVPAESQGKADLDAAAAEGRGAGPVVAGSAKKAVLGENVAKRTGTFLRESIGGFFDGLFPSPPRTSTTYTYTVSAPPAPAAPVFPQTCKGPEERVFDGEIPAGGVRVYLCPGWRGYIRGGEITITIPSGRIFRDRPGVRTPLPAEEGNHFFLAEPAGAPRGIDIYSRR